MNGQANNGRSRASYLNGMMSKYAIVLGLILSAAITADAQSGRQKPTPTPTPDEVKIVTEEVKLNVLAFDEDGKFFKDVTSNDLVISEDNVLHQPQSVRRIPANVLIVLDTGGEMRAVKNLDQTKKTAAGIVESLRAGDSFAVVQYSDRVEFLTEWTDDKSQALTAIKRAKFGRRSAFVDAIRQAMNDGRRGIGRSLRRECGHSPAEGGRAQFDRSKTGDSKFRGEVRERSRPL